ncbi:CoA pyrophosphatase [Loktanella sp. IMCC34160]|uniref:CoA pyrophosphatase n=1 Tax=Loktanella sp. IMCC34160 TaxID=2510646 RepID=UPI00101E1FD5|nr:CoA pyrophosphatase [Loktanella sp. IMCC34160]RYG91348.1 CoA pyrophosphatase [Loktanella sp. IMCC34160]
MTETEIRDRLLAALNRNGGASSDFDLNPDVALPPNRVLRPAAVLVPVMAERNDIVLTKRSARLKHHPGQIAFPGGKQDPTDATLADTALREAEEEIGLSRDMVEVLGALPTHETVTGFTVTPIVGLIHGAPSFRPEAGEVEEVFRVPFAHLADPVNFRVEGRRWQGRKRYYFTAPYGPYYIWGATARILRGLADRLAR